MRRRRRYQWAAVVCVVLLATACGETTQSTQTESEATVAENQSPQDIVGKSEESQETGAYETETWNLNGYAYHIPYGSTQDGYGNSVMVGENNEIALMVAAVYPISVEGTDIDLTRIHSSQDIFAVLQEPITYTLYDSLQLNIADTEDFTYSVDTQENVTFGERDYAKQTGIVTYSGSTAFGVEGWNRKYIYYATQMENYDNLPVWILCVDCSDDQSVSTEEMEVYAQDVCKSIKENTW